MPATSEVAKSMGNEKRSFAANERAVLASAGSSTFMAAMWRRFESRYDRLCWKCCNCRALSGEAMAQKHRSEYAPAPRSESRARRLPAISGKENSGARRGRSEEHTSELQSLR